MDLPGSSLPGIPQAREYWNGLLSPPPRDLPDPGVETMSSVTPALQVDSLPGNSAGKESTCNAGDSDSIPGLGRSAGEGIGYPLQYSWASLVAQMVKNPPAMQET